MVKVLTVGPLQENTVFFIDEETGETAIIDPGAEGERIVYALGNLKPTVILATHGHLDHVGQVGFLRKEFDIPFFMNRKDEFLIDNDIFPGFADMIDAYPCPKPDKDLKEGIEIQVGKSTLQVIETPGHTPGSVCFYDEKNGILISGDTIFRGSVGRTDLPGGDMNQLMNSLKKLINLPEDTVVYSGHGPTTTIGEEKRTNPYITGAYRLKLW
jgi:glyoxylase-like metal-dependent hydrolase (beta-lactamase superfamily II)